ncbi:MAG: hypothetical protein ACD_67C00054G0001, partial [uncultured bacterium]
MFFKKKSKETQTKPNTDGILSYRDFNHVQEKIKKVKMVEPTKISVTIKKLELRFQSFNFAVKRIIEKIKKTISPRVILNSIQDLRRLRITRLDSQ